MDLIGLDKIEKVFHCTKNMQIAEILANLLSEIHMSPGKNLQDSKEEMIVQMLDRIVVSMGDSLKAKNYLSIKKEIMLTAKAIAREE